MNYVIRFHLWPFRCLVVGHICLSLELEDSTIGGQNVWVFFLGGGGQLDRAKPREKTSIKFLKFSFLKSLQMHQILITSSYTRRTHQLILLNSSLNNHSPRAMALESSIEIHKKYT